VGSAFLQSRKCKLKKSSLRVGSKSLPSEWEAPSLRVGSIKLIIEQPAIRVYFKKKKVLQEAAKAF
jgi:hypothetical protein